MTPISKDCQIKAIRTFFTILSVSLFLAVLFLPFFQMQFSLFPDVESHEKRKLAAKPDLKHLSLKRYERYFNDNFGFRNVLVRLSGLINLKVMGVSPTIRVIVGKKGWLYYNDPSDGISLKDYQGLAGFTYDELTAIKKTMKQIKEEAELRNIILIVVVAPNKHTIYPEHLPSTYRLTKGASSRIDSIVSLWGKDSRNAFLVDLRPPLMKAKEGIKEPIFFKTDTHWNDLGAFFAYDEIMKRIRTRYASLPVLRLSDFQIIADQMPGNGDLAGFINLSGLLDEVSVRFEPIKPYRAERFEITYVQRIAEGRHVKDSNLPRLLVFGDSFSVRLIPFLSESFSRSIYMSHVPGTLTVIENERPDIVIFEFVERYVGLLDKVLTDLTFGTTR